VRARLAGLLGAMTRRRGHFGKLAGAADHFLAVTRHYWQNLFHCYDTADLPRTNNDLEQAFGTFRHAQRRATGRKGATRSEVLRGQAAIAACLATRLRPFNAQDLALANIEKYRDLRKAIDTRRHNHTLGRRFRKNSETYMDDLTQRTIKLLLPS
jgi:hypothetical protein